MGVVGYFLVFTLLPRARTRRNAILRLFFFRRGEREGNRSGLPCFDRDVRGHRVGNKAFAMGSLMERGNLLRSRRSRSTEYNPGMQDDPRDGELALLVLFQNSHGVITVAIDDKLFLGCHGQEGQHVTA